jgi:hypothetical protein
MSGMPDFAQPNDRRYTDPRFPSLEIRNDGGLVFVIYEDGVPIDEFRAIEKPKSPTVSEQFAANRAKQYFDRMSAGRMSDELLDRPPEPAQTSRSPGNRLAWKSRVQLPKPAAQHPKGPLGSPMPPGGRFGGPEDLDALVARARETGDPALKKQALSWMNQESAAQRIVRMLLSL